MIPEDGYSLRFLRSRGNQIFQESREAMRKAVVLRFQNYGLREQIASGEPIEPKPNGRHAPPTIFPKLTPRELMVLQKIVEGKTTKEIAFELNVSFKTAATHRSNIMSKLDAPNSAAVVREAFRLGLAKE